MGSFLTGIHARQLFHAWVCEVGFEETIAVQCNAYQQIVSIEMRADTMRERSWHLECLAAFKGKPFNDDTRKAIYATYELWRYGAAT